MFVRAAVCKAMCDSAVTRIGNLFANTSLIIPPGAKDELQLSAKNSLRRTHTHRRAKKRELPSPILHQTESAAGNGAGKSEGF